MIDLVTVENPNYIPGLTLHVHNPSIKKFLAIN
jgi:hypothetical protein